MFGKWFYISMAVVVGAAVSDESAVERAPEKVPVVRESSVHLDTMFVEQIVSRASPFAPPLNSLLISQDGNLVVEKYFNGMQPHRAVNIKSASKSFLSALMGIALREGFVESIDQRLVEFFPQYVDTSAAPEKKAITLRHLLSMRACLETTSFYNYGEWVTSSNWLRKALQQPMVCHPGSSMVYSTGNTHILSAILTETSGMSTRRLLQDYLLRPLGISRVDWDRSPEGYYFGGNNMALTPRALLRFGEVYLNNGRYNGQQILPEDWIRQSWQPYGHSEYSHHDFGLLWWMDRYAGHTVYFAWGHGGQYVFIVPPLDLVVVYTSSLTSRSDSDRHNDELLNLLEKTIIPAFE